MSKRIFLHIVFIIAYSSMATSLGQRPVYYSNGTEDWKLLKDNLDAKFLSTKEAGGFVGCTYGMYTTSLGRPSKNNARFNWFEYAGNDEVYK